MMLKDSPVYPAMKDPSTRAEPDMFITYLPHHTDLIYPMNGCIFSEADRISPTDTALAGAVILSGCAICTGAMIRIRGEI
jgi:hypothetical protein